MIASFAILFIVCSVGALRTPIISWISKEQVVDIGSSVQLECSVQYQSDFPVMWIKKGSESNQDLPISNGPSLILRDSRFSVRYDTSSSTYILQITDVQENDGGEYMCQVLINSLDRVNATVNLSVRPLPYILDNGTRPPTISWISKEQVVDLGSSVQLECSVQYQSDFPVMWIKKVSESNQDLPISNGPSLIVRDSRFSVRHDTSSSTYILQITDVQENDGGEYMCLVLITRLNRVSATVNLSVRRDILDNRSSSLSSLQL